MTVESTDTVLDNSTETPNEVTSFKELLPEDLRDSKVLKNFESVGDMAKSLISAQEMVGKRVKDLTADELKAVNAKFGTPESVEGYEFDAPEDFKKEALEIGLSVEQAEKLHELTVAKSETTKVDVETAMEDFAKALEGEFGGKLEAKIDLARKAALELGGKDLEGSIFQEGVPGDLKIIKALSEAGKRLFDHESVQGGIGGTKTFDEVNLEINEILANKENREILGNPLHGKNAALKQRIMELDSLRSKLRG